MPFLMDLKHADYITLHKRRMNVENFVCTQRLSNSEWECGTENAVRLKRLRWSAA
jgi:hypothetical protein